MDLNAIKNRLNQLQTTNNRTSNLWKPQPGNQIVRIVPYKFNKDNPFIELSKSSISWGDYDRDGDMDLAIMGQSNSVGAVTAIYENKDGSFVDTNQNFTNVYDGDISWVDLNKVRLAFIQLPEQQHEVQTPKRLMIHLST